MIRQAQCLGSPLALTLTGSLISGSRSALLALFIAMVGGACSLAAQPIVAAEQTSTTSRRPNLVILLADQLRYQSVGYSGDTRAQTPHLDRFAQQGISFRQFVASTPVCSAYRASLMTGKYASSTGMVVNELRINPNQDCLAHVLTSHGYHTGYIGKWHLWSNVAGQHRDPINAYTPPGPFRLGFDGDWSAYNFNHDNYKAWTFQDSPEPHRITGYGPDHFTDLAIDYLKRRQAEDRPFALVVS